MDNYKIYKSEKNRQDRIIAQKRYYDANKDKILLKLKTKRLKERIPTEFEQKLLDTYISLQNYLRSINLI